MSQEYTEIELNIDEDVLLTLALEAHRRDMKLNDYILEIIMEYCEQVENDQ